jgi:small-conductance mechanosensitive channel
VRIVVKLSIAYSSDLERALLIMNEVAREQPRVLASPEPGAFVTAFGADGVELELGFWIRDPEEGTLAVRSAISRELLKRFAMANIEIPYPRRDVRLLGPQGLETALASHQPEGTPQRNVEGS